MEYEPILKPGDMILNGKYQVEAFLGQGAFSQVYRVQHLELKTERAVKMVSQELPGVDAATVDRFRARFRLEAQLGEQLGNPHIIHVYDFEEAEDRLYLSMDCAAGGSLAKLLENGPLSIDEAVRFTSETAAGLQALHEFGIIHRDVKPSNLLLDGEGRVKVGDLGLAQVPKKLRDRSGMDSRAAAHPGTPEYMSPEQATTVGYLTPSSDV
jgi:eukaryotic-like serine/threonine-protein kinase